VDKDATPDDVYRDEQERLLNQVGNTISTGLSDSSTYDGSSNSSPKAVGSAESVDSQNAEAVLASFASAAVSNNFLGDEWLGDDNDVELDDEELEMQRKILDEQIDDWLNNDDSQDPANEENEIWDYWASESTDEDSIIMDDEQHENMKPDEFANEEEKILEEKQYLEKLSQITLKCERLDKAMNNSNAASYFARDPDASEGFDRMWVSAIDDACMRNLVGLFKNYGVQFSNNFGEWEDGSEKDALWSIEDIAAYKARAVYEVTGLPCIASRSSFEVEPVRTSSIPGGAASPRVSGLSPRVASGYRFNDISDNVDQIVGALQPSSDPCRLTQFRSVLCFYDGEMEIFDYGECDVDLALCNSMRTFVTMSTAIQEMCESLQLAYSLAYQPWVKRQVRESRRGYEPATLKLRDRVLKEGKVLPNNIIDVSSFMDSMVDVNLMDECGIELGKRFVEMKPTKILTVATTGLVIAIPMAKYLQVPCVYARKERSVTMADTYQAFYSSKTVGKNRELIVSKSHIDSTDRILIIDDFLSSGAGQEALLRIISDAGALCVGVGVLIEKVYDSGRTFLSGFDVPVESMVGVASVKDTMITLVEEDGFNVDVI